MISEAARAARRTCGPRGPLTSAQCTAQQARRWPEEYVNMEVYTLWITTHVNSAERFDRTCILDEARAGGL